jgi:hypothetical protein
MPEPSVPVYRPGIRMPPLVVDDLLSAQPSFHPANHEARDHQERGDRKHNRHF